jgi:chloramphenicol 3-O-phosphotransferase
MVRKKIFDPESADGPRSCGKSRLRLIFLHGLAAVGKLTVAKALAARTGFALFHNHLVVDTVLAVFPFGSEPFIRLRNEYWLTMFEEAARRNRSLIFTFAPEASVPLAFIDDVKERVLRHGGTIHFVGLTCDDTEQERRIENADRKQFRKLASLETLRAIRAHGRPFGLIPPRDLSIDTGTCSPDEAAEQIISRFALSPDRGA